jgi:hypothetical protein
MPRRDRLEVKLSNGLGLSDVSREKDDGCQPIALVKLSVHRDINGSITHIARKL